MTRCELIDYCLTYPDANEDYPFDEFASAPDSWAVMRHKGNKGVSPSFMSAVACA